MNGAGIAGLIIIVLFVLIILLYRTVAQRDKEIEARNLKEANERIQQQAILDSKIKDLLEQYKQKWKLYKDYEPGRLLYLVKEYATRTKITNILKEPEKITRSQYKQMIDEELAYEKKQIKYNISDK